MPSIQEGQADAVAEAINEAQQTIAIAQAPRSATKAPHGPSDEAASEVQGHGDGLPAGEEESKAREEEKRQIEAIKERVEAGASGESVEEAEAGDEIAPEDDEEDKNLLALQLPFARVTKIVKLNNDLVKISRDACFLMARVTELFVERSVIEAAGTTARAGRKTVMLSDILASSLTERDKPRSPS